MTTIDLSIDDEDLNQQDLLDEAVNGDNDNCSFLNGTSDEDVPKAAPSPMEAFPFLSMPGLNRRQIDKLFQESLTDSDDNRRARDLCISIMFSRDHPEETGLVSPFKASVKSINIIF